MPTTKSLPSLTGHGAIYRGKQVLATCRYILSMTGVYEQQDDGPAVLIQTTMGRGELSRVTSDIPMNVPLTLETLDNGNFSIMATQVLPTPGCYEVAPA